MASKRKDTNGPSNKLDDDKEGGTGQGGKSGDIQFRDFLSGGEGLRDDLLPPDVLKRLLSVHQDANESRVKKQKDLQDRRALLKSGKISLEDYRQQSMDQGMEQRYKSHPVFEKAAQFHDATVNALPSEANTQTNDELKNQLKNEYQLKYAPQHVPQFNPKLTRQ